MRNLFVFMMVSLDGFFEGENHDLSWHQVDEDFNNNFIIPQTKKVGSMLFGKRTYEMMESYWQSDEGRNDDPITAKIMNDTEKYVFSTTLEKTEWTNSTLISKNTVDTVRKLKEQGGTDIAIFGSNTLMVSLAEAGLIDEFRIVINPLIIGKGTVLFHGIKEKVDLQLIDNKKFKNGNILLTYSPNKS